MNTDSTFYKTIEQYYKQPFNWKTHNCGLFVGKVYTKMYNKDFVTPFMGYYNDESSARQYVEDNGGWDTMLKTNGFIKRENNSMTAGDVVVCDNAIGIYDGNLGLFAGGAYRRRSKLKTAYYYTEK